MTNSNMWLTNMRPALCQKRSSTAVTGPLSRQLQNYSGFPASANMLSDTHSCVGSRQLFRVPIACSDTTRLSTALVRVEASDQHTRLVAMSNVMDAKREPACRHIGNYFVMHLSD